MASDIELSASISGLEEAKEKMLEMMKEVHNKSSHSGAELVQKWTKNICYFLADECQKDEHKGKWYTDLEGLRKEQDYKISNLRRGEKITQPNVPFTPGRGKAREQQITQVAKIRGGHAFALSGGWRAARKIVAANGDIKHSYKNSFGNGGVEIEFHQDPFTRISVTIHNYAKYGADWLLTHNTYAKAFNRQARDLYAYTQKVYGDLSKVPEEFFRKAGL